MAKKKKNIAEHKENFIQEQPITTTLEQNYMPYAMSVIVSRAIPEIDGLKPSHRKLLYTMYQMGLLRGDRTKSTNVVGQTMKLNPHGDAAIYETLVRLTDGNGALLTPLVDSKGNFGKQYSRDMACAASRYTEVKLAPICAEIFADIDKNTVDFTDNYDGSMKEPLLLPTTFPNILANPNLGIAVGMASAICSFNLAELCEATAAFIKDPSADLCELLPAPDFSTGAQLIYNRKELEQIYRTGRGSIKLRAKYRYDAKNNCIEIYEIPYTTNIETIIDKIIALVKNGKIREITDIRDETDLNGLKIAIDIKRSTNAELLMHKLYSLTPLSDSFSCNFNVLIQGHPMTLGIGGILQHWTEFRMDAIRRQTAFDIQKKTEKQHLLEGLAKILLDIDKAISIIRNTELESMVVPNLMTGFDIDEVQAEYIAEIRLRNINKEYILKRTAELDELKKEIEELKQILGSDTKIKNIICRQLKAIAKKYGQPRKTEIVQEEEIPTLDKEDFIEDYGIRLFLTEQNYFKKISLVSLRSAGEQKLKEDDRMLLELESTNRADLLFFSDQCNVYKLKANDAPDTKASALGEYLPNLLGMEPEEHILYMTATTDYSGFMVFFFENGKGVKVPLSSYATKTNRKKLVNAYSSRAALVYMEKLDADRDYLLMRNSDKATVLNTELLPAAASKNAAGVQLYTLKKNSSISRVCPAEEFVTEDLEYYRTRKIPTTGHFIQEKDKANNQVPGQIRL
ncbi:topoisomerase IV [Anaerotignum lactatifermentans]|uniref:Topoisomerase IV n=1 Tax=Anaerotignum lactatifermentans TaxID=160404 RepID=A0ABS2G5V8_9FIRM|nr:DNA topoisomerase (ATP-hydrolyzing) subunit A [Anaerotignum lactatifermentans]MBM6828990.1 topoisomerase IV [Anaerotignum lactatifermentans]MBM6876836.1 topoisomerase IV [Anaerotignum lactatifermentans]MBM6950395.1 topoisomerase IV [Anaerotignum lactatifermentans]